MGATERDEELIYDWNRVGDDGAPCEARHARRRDAPRRAAVALRRPIRRIEKKIALLHLMDELGIDTADIGLPGAGPRAVGAT